MTVLALATLATGYIGYQVYSRYAYQTEISSLPGDGIHRSNAVRRRRRNTTSNSDPSSLFVDDQIENDGEGHIVARTLTDGETVVDDQEYSWTHLPPSYQRSGQNIVQLLFRVSEDATRRNAYVHRGCLCNSCGIVPIRGIRYRCANCADYDLCENCESQGVHSKAHIFYKIKVPAPAFGPRHIQPVWYTGDPSGQDAQLPKHISTKLSRETGFERPELDAYWEQWTYMANTDWRDDPDDIRLAMDRKTFERCLVPSGGYRLAAPSLIFDRMFAFYDTNKDDLISFSEFLHGIAYRKKKDKWKKIFEGYDIDGDGYVDRKDFLRIFRSYYVLYRQMHRDMLEGMEDQQMGTNEAHRLVSGRQPLSSAFGQDGRFPRAPDPRTGEGKVKRANGDEEIADGKGVMSENGNDTGSREDVFRRNVPRINRNRTDEEGRHQSPGYWATLLNPPETMNQMSGVLDDLEVRREVAELLDVLEPNARHAHRVIVQEMFNPNESHPDREAADSNADETRTRADLASGDMFDQEWPPTSVAIIDEDIQAVEGPGVSIEDVPEASRKAVIAHALHREKAQRQIYERWQRRGFYTDEEEGAAPPANWKEEDDILVRAGLTAGESSKTLPTRHSRSSSKVRFAEDMDDFDTRSNPSTSSRSVPERWGGMDIPDAEKDAGKEILFQVTQQAFNELLDPLFKESEDLAMEVAATKAERDEYRAVWETHEFEEWALEREANEKNEKAQEHRTPTPPNITSNPVWPTFQEVEVEQVRDRTLGELLAATGYTVDEDNEEVTMAELRRVVSLPDSAYENPPAPLFSPETCLPAQSVDVYTEDEDVNLLSDDSTPPQPTPQDSEPDSPTYRDPTLPQFRPSGVPTSVPVPQPLSEIHEEDIPPRPTNDFIPLTAVERKEPEISPPPKPERTVGGEEEDHMLFQDREGLMKERAYHLWRCDKAQEEADMRGGFGRLNWKEFDERVKRAIGREGRGSQMDYLGSWIEFCIP